MFSKRSPAKYLSKPSNGTKKDIKPSKAALPQPTRVAEASSDENSDEDVIEGDSNSDSDNDSEDDQQDVDGLEDDLQDVDLEEAEEVDEDAVPRQKIIINNKVCLPPSKHSHFY